MKVLVTGASGFIGSALIERLKSVAEDIVCQSRFYRPDKENFIWLKHNMITDSWNALSRDSVDVVYHLAGQTSVYDALANPLDDLNTNVVSFVRLLEYLRTWDRPPFVVLAGTVTQVGLVDELPITERTPDNPITFYDTSKLTAEMYLNQYVRDGLVTGCTLRFANIFGRHVPGQKKDRGILDKIFKRALSGQSITIFGDGNQIRDYLFIDDLVDALLLAPDHATSTNGRVFNLGTGHGTTLKQAFLKVVSIAEKTLGHSIEIQHVEPPKELSMIEYRNAVFDCSAFSEATGWTAKYDFDRALQEAYENPHGGQ